MSREMIDSGVEWIGEIPKDWRVTRIKNVLFERKENNIPVKTNRILSLMKDKGVIPYEEKGDIGNKAKEDVTKYKIAYPSDIVLNSMNMIIGSVGISDYYGAVSPVYYVLNVKDDKFSNKFINYVFHTKEFQNNLKGIGNGILEHRMRIKMDKLNNELITIPTINIQNKIVKYLDKVIGIIDLVIYDTYLSIEELKKYKQSLITEAVTKGLDKNVEMKDSGIEWIGEIPKNWEMTKLRYQIIIDPSTSEINVIPEDSTFLPMEKLKNGYMDIKLKGKTLENMKKYTYFAEGDITIAKVRPSFENGNIAIAKNLISKIGFGTSEIFTIRNQNKDILQEFLFYFLQNQSFIKYASSTMTGVAGLKRISSSILRDTKITVPNLNEQKQIINFLNQKTNDIETLIDKKKSLINEYESYKKSLIYEYVTGKKEVGEEEK